MTPRSERLAVSSQKTGKIQRLLRLVICLPIILFLLTFAEAQQQKKIPHIGVLRPDRPGNAGGEALINAFRQGLRKLGYVEGQNIALEQRFADGKLERLPNLAADLVRLKVDVVLAINVPASQAAKQATKTIPIVFTWVGDPSPTRD